MDAAQVDEWVEAGYQIQATKFLFLASLTVLIFDHLLTLKDEIRYFWRQRPSFITALFFFNRYYTHVAFIFISFLFFSPGAVDPKMFASLSMPRMFSLTKSHCRCTPASLFLPLGGTLPISLSSSLLLTTRVYAIYNRNNFLLAFLLTFLTAATGVSLWIYGFAGHEPLTLLPIPLDAFRICIDETPPTLPQKTAITWIMMQCSFDLTILVLTLWRSLQVGVSRGDLFRAILRDGIWYFVCIFSSNFAWAMMVLAASPGVKYLIAIPNLAFCATIVSRISLNLRIRANSGSTLEDIIASATVPKFRKREVHKTDAVTIEGTTTLDASIRAFHKLQRTSANERQRYQYEMSTIRSVD